MWQWYIVETFHSNPGIVLTYKWSALLSKYIYNYLTLWSSALLERSPVVMWHSIVFQHFMEPEGSIPNSQELSTCSYPELDQSSPHHPIPPLVTLCTHLHLFLASGLFPSCFPTNLFSPFIPHALPSPSYPPPLDYLFIYIYICVCMYIYIYIYICIWKSVTVKETGTRYLMAEWMAFRVRLTMFSLCM
jgi:hypothetical protein